MHQLKWIVAKFRPDSRTATFFCVAALIPRYRRISERCANVTTQHTQPARRSGTSRAASFLLAPLERPYVYSHVTVGFAITKTIRRNTAQCLHRVYALRGQSLGLSCHRRHTRLGNNLRRPQAVHRECPHVNALPDVSTQTCRTQGQATRESGFSKCRANYCFLYLLRQPYHCCTLQSNPGL
jgi:hypothetical protein